MFRFLNTKWVLSSDKGKNATGHMCGRTLRCPPEPHSRGIVDGRQSGHGGRGGLAVQDEVRFERGLLSLMFKRDSEGHGNCIRL